jgi:hypothetical protein
MQVKQRKGGRKHGREKSAKGSFFNAATMQTDCREWRSTAEVKASSEQHCMDCK